MRRGLEPLEALALGELPEQVAHVDVPLVGGNADGGQVLVDARPQLVVPGQLPVGLAQVQRADIADGEQRVAAGRSRVGEDARIQVEVVVGLGLVDVAGAATGDRLELLELQPDPGRKCAGRDVELLGRERGEAALVVGDPPERGPVGAHREASSVASGLACGNCPGAVRIALAAVAAVRELGQRGLALDDAGVAAQTLLSHEVVELLRLADVLRHVRRERRRHLADAQELEREARLADRLDDPLRVRHELRLAEPAGGAGRGDEPLRVLGAHVAVDPLLDRLGAELCDRVARVDALRAALVAEVAAGALPDRRSCR